MIRQCSTTWDESQVLHHALAARWHSRRAGHHHNRAFTIVELLVVVAIIITLLSVVIVAVNAATKAGQNTRTIALMGSIRQALIQFKEEVGYYPPILGVNHTTAGPAGTAPNGAELRKLFRDSVPSPNLAVSSLTNYRDHMQEYYSTCTLADYLIGYGSHREDGYGRVPGLAGAPAWEPEDPPLGIRPPGDDGVWGATLAAAPANYGNLNQRMLYGNSNWGGYSNATPAPAPPIGPYPWDLGKVLGPYLPMSDERLIAGVNYGANGLQTYFQGDALPAGLSWDTIPKAIVDYWGMPIRYYRRPYPPGAITQSYRSVFDPATNAMTHVPSLSDVFVLRPKTIKPGSESPNRFADTGTPANSLSSRELDSAEFALLSAGPDKRVNNNALFHEDNADNVVEVGP